MNGASITQRNTRNGSIPSMSEGPMTIHAKSQEPRLSCWFCGGKVEAIGPHVRAVRYRCEEEGVTWEATDNLTVYHHTRSRWRRKRDPDSGKFVPSEAST